MGLRSESGRIRLGLAQVHRSREHAHGVRCSQGLGVHSRPWELPGEVWNCVCDTSVAM